MALFSKQVNENISVHYDDIAKSLPQDSCAICLLIGNKFNTIK